MKNVAIITGGDSAEYDISLLSADTVLKNLDRNKFNPYLIEIKNGIWKIKIDGQFYEISNDLFIKVHSSTKKKSLKNYCYNNCNPINWVHAKKKCQENLLI